MTSPPERGEHPSLAGLRRLQPVARSPVIRAFVAHLLLIHPGHRLPTRREFDPVDVPSLLPNLALVQVYRDPIGFEYRVVGDRIREAVGMPMRGERLELLAAAGDSEDGPLRDRAKTLETGEPVYRYGAPRIPFKLDFARIEVCHMPLAGDDGSIGYVLSAFVYEAQEPGPFGSTVTG